MVKDHNFYLTFIITLVQVSDLPRAVYAVRILQQIVFSLIQVSYFQVEYHNTCSHKVLFSWSVPVLCTLGSVVSQNFVTAVDYSS